MGGGRRAIHEERYEKKVQRRERGRGREREVSL